MKRISSRDVEATVWHASADRLREELYPAVIFCFALAAIVTLFLTGAGALMGIGATLVLLVVVAGADNCIKAGTQRDSTGKPKGFILIFGGDVVTLSPGISWAQVDRYKWGARGLVDEPQTFHVLLNGTVEINSEKICLTDPAGAEKLQREINKRHATTVAQIANALTTAHTAAALSQASGPQKLHFKVKLDRFGHMLIEYILAGERGETGLRGISSLITNGLMAAPDSLHVDPMQRAIEIDEIRYECTGEGAQLLEEALNRRYVPHPRDDRGIVVAIKENIASNTGFDIRFMTVRAGIPVEVKEHLSQDNLDILTDHTKCELLQPGIQIRLAPPYLLIRRRRPDMGEDKIPGLPDINYLQITAMQFQRILNHPSIRKEGLANRPVTQEVDERPADIVELRVVRNPANGAQLWLECVTADGKMRERKAFTHHNIVNLQRAGFFLPNIDVCLSLDCRVLSISNRQNKLEERFAIDDGGSDEELAAASRMLTMALKSPTIKSTGKRGPVRVETKDAARPVAASLLKQAATIEQGAKGIPPHRRETFPGATPQTIGVAQSKAALFQETDPVRINREIFRRLRAHFGVDVQEARFSLPRIFEDRRFEIINFCEGEVESLMELRGGDFCGLYLSHVNEQKQVLGYACNGAHLEWGPDWCVFQPSADVEAEKYPASALLGFGLNRNEEVVFVVQLAFKEWIKPREKQYNDLLIHFKSTAELSAALGEYDLIWPEKPVAEMVALPLIGPPRQMPRLSGAS